MGRLGSHPHIVTVFDLGDHEGQPYMVTELMEGGDVEGLIGELKQLVGELSGLKTFVSSFAAHIAAEAAREGGP